MAAGKRFQVSSILTNHVSVKYCSFCFYAGHINDVVYLSRDRYRKQPSDHNILWSEVRTNNYITKYIWFKLFNQLETKYSKSKSSITTFWISSRFAYIIISVGLMRHLSIILDIPIAWLIILFSFSFSFLSLFVIRTLLYHYLLYVFFYINISYAYSFIPLFVINLLATLWMSENV